MSRWITVAAIFLVSLAFREAAAAEHLRYKDAVVGPDGTRAVAIVCVTDKGVFMEAHLTLSSGDDAVDDKALAFARTQLVTPLVRSGKPRATCREITMRVGTIDDPVVPIGDLSH